MESLAFEVWVTINRDLYKTEIIELTKAWENGKQECGYLYYAWIAYEWMMKAVHNITYQQFPILNCHLLSLVY